MLFLICLCWHAGEDLHDGLVSHTLCYAVIVECYGSSVPTEGVPRATMLVSLQPCRVVACIETSCIEDEVFASFYWYSVISLLQKLHNVMPLSYLLFKVGPCLSI